MSVWNGKVCCNCRHNIQCPQDGDRAKIKCYCELDNHYIGYVESMEYWCKHWAKDKEGAEE